jgi:hypothetical protein
MQGKYVSPTGWIMGYRWAIVESKKPHMAIRIYKDVEQAVAGIKGYRYTRKFNIVVAITPEHIGS